MSHESAGLNPSHVAGRPARWLTRWQRFLLTAALPASFLFSSHAEAQEGPTIWERIASGGASDDPRIGEAQRLMAEDAMQMAAWRLEEVLAETPESLVAASLLARCYIGLSEYENALQATEAALQAGAPDNEPLQFYRAYALAFLGRVDEAAEALTAATQFRTDLQDLHVYLSNLAELRVMQGDLTGAQTLWQQSLARSSSYGPAMVGYVFTLVGTGRANDAATMVRRELLRDPELFSEVESTVEWLDEGIELPFRILATRSGINDQRGIGGMTEDLRNSTAGALLGGAIDELVAAANAPSPVQRIDRAPCPFHTLSRSEDGSRWAGVCNAGGMRLGQRNADGTITWRPRRTDTNGTNSTLPPDVRISADGQLVTLLYSPVRVQTLPFSASQSDTPTALPIDDTVQALYQASNCVFSPGASHFACYANTSYPGDEAVVIDTSDMTISNRGPFSVTSGVVRLNEDGSLLVGSNENGIFQGVTGNMYAAPLHTLATWLSWGVILPMAVNSDGSLLVYWDSNQLILLDVQGRTPIDQWRLEATTVSVTATAYGTFLIGTNDALYEWDPEFSG